MKYTEQFLNDFKEFINEKSSFPFSKIENYEDDFNQILACQSGNYYFELSNHASSSFNPEIFYFDVKVIEIDDDVYEYEFRTFGE